MSKDPFDNPELKAYLRRAQEEMFPKLESSAISVTILSGKPDPKLCLELGASILFDKPIIVLVPDDTPVPANLKRCASAIVEGNPRDPATLDRLRRAIDQVLKNDRRRRV